MSRLPLVSCIMPTRNRRRFVGRSIEYFLRQDYPHRELIIVDDGDDAVADLVPADPRVRYLRAGDDLPLGTKRNLACEQGRGEFICHWDDDDWMAADRLTRQVAALSAADADATGTARLLYYRPRAGDAWLYTGPSASRPWVAGGTLLYRRSAWAAHPFPPLDVGEDTAFVWALEPDRVVVMSDHRFYVALLHGANTARKYLAGTAWQRCPLDEVARLLVDDRDFYAALRSGASGDDPAGYPRAATSGRQAQEMRRLPLVSCIMPTARRGDWVERSIRNFERQGYPHRELIVVDDDDGHTPSASSAVAVRVLRTPAGTSIGAKRNLACSAAAGDLVAHWDDDDWYGPDRLAAQVEPIAAGSADVTGLVGGCYLELQSWQCWTPTAALHRRLFRGDVHGGTLVYRRSLWENGARYPRTSLAEDAAFLQACLQRGARLAPVSADEHFVYVRHPGSTWRLAVGVGEGWVPDSLPDMPASDEAFYRSKAQVGHPDGCR